MSHTHAKYEGRKSVGSNAGVETNERTRPIALPSPLPLSVTSGIVRVLLQWRRHVSDVGRTFVNVCVYVLH